MEAKKAKINGLQSKLYGRLLPPSFRLSLARSQLSRLTQLMGVNMPRLCVDLWTGSRMLWCGCIASALLAT